MPIGMSGTALQDEREDSQDIQHHAVSRRGQARNLDNRRCLRHPASLTTASFIRHKKAPSNDGAFSLDSSYGLEVLFDHQHLLDITMARQAQAVEIDSTG